MKTLAFSALMLAGCFEAATPPAVDPQVIYREAQIDAWCADPRLDQQSRNWCATRAAYQQRMAAQAQIDRETGAENERRREARAAAFRQALAPLQQPTTPATTPAPIIAPAAQPRTCTSLVNGQIVSTTCF